MNLKTPSAYSSSGRFSKSSGKHVGKCLGFCFSRLKLENFEFCRQKDTKLDIEKRAENASKWPNLN